MTFVRVEGLSIDTPSGARIVEDVSFDVNEGEIVAVVGESGSGKTTLGMALLGHTARGARIRSGVVTVGDLDLRTAGSIAMRQARGDRVAYVPQDPGTALDPLCRVGSQLLEHLAAHDRGSTRAARRQRVREVLRDVQLPTTRDFLRRWPHELSGGQQQRVCIAMAIARRPSCIVFDEPTTGLDVTTQAHVLETIRVLCRSHQIAGVYISHDLAVVAQLAQRVVVLYGGIVVEAGSVADVFSAPQHPYTAGLLEASPEVDQREPLHGIPGTADPPALRRGGCPFAPRCDFVQDECRAAIPSIAERTPGHGVRCVLHGGLARQLRSRTEIRPQVRTRKAAEPALRVSEVTAFYGKSPVTHAATFVLNRRECLALVGQSGSGKTTIARVVSGLHGTYDGEVSLDGVRLAPLVRNRPRAATRAIQTIFQNPYASLNPRQRVIDIVARPVRHFEGVSRLAARARVHAVLDRVSLSSTLADSYPAQLSGGERQRVAIARAILCEPQVLICDEVTSALDVSVQAVIVELLRDLSRELGMSLLFVTHNLAVVRSIADRVAVMDTGHIVEVGDVDDILTQPTEPYTRQLLADTPRRVPVRS